MTLRIASLCSVALSIAVGSGVYATRVSASKSQAPQDVLEQPADWVAFTADYKSTSKGRQATGRYYRDSSGSTRSERMSPDQTQTAINIQNRAQQMAWLKNPVSGTWAGRVMANKRPKPLAYVKHMTGLSEFPEPTTVEGFKVYRLDNPASGEYQLLAPELNFFPLTIVNGEEREDYLNIHIEEPNRLLFLPPPGVSVKIVSGLKDLFHSLSGGEMAQPQH